MIKAQKSKANPLRSKDCPILVVSDKMSNEPHNTQRKTLSSSQQAKKVFPTANLCRTQVVAIHGHEKTVKVAAKKSTKPPQQASQKSSESQPIRVRVQPAKPSADTSKERNISLGKQSRATSKTSSTVAIEKGANKGPSLSRTRNSCSGNKLEPVKITVLLSQQQILEEDPQKVASEPQNKSRSKSRESRSSQPQDEQRLKSGARIMQTTKNNAAETLIQENRLVGRQAKAQSNMTAKVNSGKACGSSSITILEEGRGIFRIPQQPATKEPQQSRISKSPQSKPHYKSPSPEKSARHRSSVILQSNALKGKNSSPNVLVMQERAELLGETSQGHMMMDPSSSQPIVPKHHHRPLLVDDDQQSDDVANAVDAQPQSLSNRISKVKMGGASASGLQGDYYDHFGKESMFGLFSRGHYQPPPQAYYHHQGSYVQHNFAPSQYHYHHPHHQYFDQNYDQQNLLQTTHITRRKIFQGTIGYQMPDLPAELGILHTPNCSPYRNSQPSSNSKFTRNIVGMGELFKDAKQQKRSRQAKAQTTATKDKTTITSSDQKSISERRVEKQQEKMAKAYDAIVIESRNVQQPIAPLIEFDEDQDGSISDEMIHMLPLDSAENAVTLACDQTKLVKLNTRKTSSRQKKATDKALNKQQISELQPVEQGGLKMTIIEPTSAKQAENKPIKINRRQNSVPSVIPDSSQQAKILSDGKIFVELAPVSNHSQINPVAQGPASPTNTQMMQLELQKDSSRRCHCKGGKCRQLYCICLKRGVACDPKFCQCLDCQNDERESAELARLEQVRILNAAVRRGCNCKRNNCLKNYCICHSQGLHCIPELCQCHDCYYFEGAGPPPSKQNSENLKGSDAKKRRRGETNVAVKIEEAANPQ